MPEAWARRHGLRGREGFTARAAEGAERSNQAIEHVSTLAEDLRGLIAELRDCADEKEEN